MNYEDRVTKAAVEAAIEGSIVCGTYTGNNTENRFIDLGFTPRAVFIMNNTGTTYTTMNTANVNYYFGGLVLPGSPLMENSRVNAEIVDGGFTVTYLRPNEYFVDATNISGFIYHYIAFK